MKWLSICVLCVYMGVSVASDFEQTVKGRERETAYCKQLIQALSPEDCKELRNKIDLIGQVCVHYNIDFGFATAEQQQKAGQVMHAIDELLSKYTVPRSWGFMLRNELKLEYLIKEEAACKDTLAKMASEDIARLKAIMQQDESFDQRKVHIEEVVATDVPFYHYATWVSTMQRELKLEQKN